MEECKDLKDFGQRTGDFDVFKERVVFSNGMYASIEALKIATSAISPPCHPVLFITKLKVFADKLSMCDLISLPHKFLLTSSH